MTNGVYALVFKNGKRYVGKSVIANGRGIENRWCAYKRYRCKDQPRLYNALKKYGSDNVEYKVILITNDDNMANVVEKNLIALWGLQKNKYGYNITEGGERSTRGIKYPFRPKSEKHRKKISEALMNRTMSMTARNNISKGRIGKYCGVNHPNVKIRTVRNIVTGQILTGCLSELSQNNTLFNSSHVCSRGHSKGWELVESLVENSIATFSN
jgi:group I intron endonuclease